MEARPRLTSPATGTPSPTEFGKLSYLSPHFGEFSGLCGERPLAKTKQSGCLVNSPYEAKSYLALFAQDSKGSINRAEACRGAPPRGSDWNDRSTGAPRHCLQRLGYVPCRAEFMCIRCRSRLRSHSIKPITKPTGSKVAPSSVPAWM